MNTQMHYIAATGLMGSGKSHILRRYADYVESRVGIRPVAIDISLPLKVIAADAVGEDVDYVEEHKGEFRLLLQELGRLIRMARGQNYLIEEAVSRARQVPFAYIENVRMPVEFKVLRDNGWTLFGVEADETVRVQRLERSYGRTPTADEVSHETERHIPHLMNCVPVFHSNTPREADDAAALLANITLGLMPNVLVEAPRP